MVAVEKTLVIIKPDAVCRKLVGRIVQRFEDKGFEIVAMKMLHISKSLAQQHYQQHKNKSFYESAVEHIQLGPALVMVLEGRDAIQVVRQMVGRTFGNEAEVGTIRGDFALDEFNLVHASDSVQTAHKEMSLFFSNGS